MITLAGNTSNVDAFIRSLQADGRAEYVDRSVQGTVPRTVIVLSDPSQTYDVASQLLSMDPNITMTLEAYVSSDETFEFRTPEGSVNTSIPRSKVRLSRPYRVGDVLAFRALAQIVDGRVAAAKLTQMAIQEYAELAATVDAFYPQYYARYFYYWRDRALVRGNLSALNDSLKSLGAENVKINYVSDTTVYVSRSLRSAEVEAIRERLPGLKTVQFNRVVFYDNYTYTEDEVYAAIENATNGTVNVTFSKAMLEVAFEYSGNASDAAAVFEGFGFTPVSGELYRLANVSIGGGSVVIKGREYAVKEMEKRAYVSAGKRVGDIAILRFDVSILGDEVVDAEQVFARE